MKSWMLSIGLFVLTCLSSNAQDYAKLLHGQPSPYDTAIAIHLPQYRAIRHNVAFADQYIASLRRTIDSLNTTITQYRYLASLQKQIIEQQDAYAVKNAESFKDLSTRFDKLAATLTPRKKWYDRPLVWIAIGALSAEGMRAIFTR